MPRFSVDVPVLVIPPAPEMTPLYARLFVPPKVKVVPEVIAILLASVLASLFEVMAASPVTLTEPVPSALSLPRVSVPAESIVPPV